MAFQREVGGSSNRATDVRDLLTKLVAFATSQHVATVAINNGGTGGTYVVGDVVTLTDASAYLDARFEVLTVSAGQILTMRIQDSGAFAIRASSATVGTGGSGYVVGDILQVQGGSAREEAKFEVATLSGSAVATVTLFETGGAYSSTPSNDAATLGIGPSTFAGDDACELTVTYGSLIGTTGLSVTGGGGSGATVDITLAETGWDASERNTNDRLITTFDLQKQVTFKGDASGKTNKPFFSIRTRVDESGVIDRFNLELNGQITHNASLDVDSQLLPSTSVFMPGNEDELQDIDFWISADDQRIFMVTNINPGAGSTDDGVYMHLYAGYLDTFATESEDPYPMMVFASSRTANVDPAVASQSITGISECVAPTASTAPCYYYRAEDSSWVNVFNSQNLSASQEVTNGMFPLCQVPIIDSTSFRSYNVSAPGPISFYTGIGSTSRASPSVRYMPIPGTTPVHLPIPLTIISRPGDAAPSATLDTVRGQVRGVYWISASTGTGSTPATITDFSEDFVTIGSDRYRVFHTHVHTQLYHYICVLEDV